MAVTVNNDDIFNIDDIVKDHLTNLQNCLNECIYHTVRLIYKNYSVM